MQEIDDFLSIVLLMIFWLFKGPMAAFLSIYEEKSSKIHFEDSSRS